MPDICSINESECIFGSDNSRFQNLFRFIANFSPCRCGAKWANILLNEIIYGIIVRVWAFNSSLDVPNAPKRYPIALWSYSPRHKSQFSMNFANFTEHLVWAIDTLLHARTDIFPLIVFYYQVVNKFIIMQCHTLCSITSSSLNNKWHQMSWSNRSEKVLREGAQKPQKS